jgi:hypothetical protein
MNKTPVILGVLSVFKISLPYKERQQSWPKKSHVETTVLLQCTSTPYT